MTIIREAALGEAVLTANQRQQDVSKCEPQERKAKPMDRTRENNANEPNATGTVGEAAATAAQRVGETLDQGRAALADIQAAVTERTRECMETTDTYVRDNPWQSVGIAAGIGVILGLLLGRR